MWHLALLFEPSYPTCATLCLSEASHCWQRCMKFNVTFSLRSPRCPPAVTWAWQHKEIASRGNQDDMLVTHSVRSVAYNVWNKHKIKPAHRWEDNRLLNIHRFFRLQQCKPLMLPSDRWWRVTSCRKGRDHNELKCVQRKTTEKPLKIVINHHTSKYPGATFGFWVLLPCRGSETVFFLQLYLHYTEPLLVSYIHISSLFPCLHCFIFFAIVTGLLCDKW